MLSERACALYKECVIPLLLGEFFEDPVLFAYPLSTSWSFRSARQGWLHVFLMRHRIDVNIG